MAKNGFISTFRVATKTRGFARLVGPCFAALLGGSALVTAPAAGSSTSGYAYVANAGSGTVSVIDVTTNTVVGTVTVGSGPYGVATTPGGSTAYVTNSGSNSVSVIDVATNTVVGTVTVGKSPEGVAITPNGAFAYVTNEALAP